MKKDEFQKCMLLIKHYYNVSTDKEAIDKAILGMAFLINKELKILD